MDRPSNKKKVVFWVRFFSRNTSEEKIMGKVNFEVNIMTILFISEFFQNFGDLEVDSGISLYRTLSKCFEMFLIN